MNPRLPNILIVDDHPANLVALNYILEKTEANIISADSGMQALNLATSETFAMVLLDVQMPDMNGFEVATLLRGTKRHKETPILFISASYTKMSDCLQGYSVGAVDYILKPVDDLIVLSKVTVFLELFESRRQQTLLLEKLQTQNDLMAKEIQTRKKVEVELRESLNRLADAQEIAHIGDWEWNLLTDKLTYSKEIQKIFGWDKIQYSDRFQTLTDAIHPDERDTFLKTIHTAQTSNNPKPFESEQHIIRTDGQVGVIHLNGKIYRDLDNNPLRMIGTIRDVTEQREAEKMVRAKQMAEEANRAKSVFLASMSHELRTPMNAIIGMTDLCLATQLSSEQRRYLETALHAANNLLNLLNTILSFSKMEAKGTKLFFRPFCPFDLLKEVCESLSHAANQKNLTLQFDIDPRIPSNLEGSLTHLRQILVNITNNAIKFTESGEIILRAHLLDTKQINDQPGVMVQFSVTDTGIGILPEHHEIIFQHFQQINEGSNRLYSGAGLGLAICKQLVTLMKGEIQLKSTPNKGSCFDIFIPFNVGPGEWVGSFATGTINFPPMTALLLQKPSQARTILCTLLSRLAIQVIPVENEQHLFDELDSDLLLLDTQMQEMQSVDFFQKLANHPNKPKHTLLISPFGSAPATLPKEVSLKISDTFTVPTDPFQIIQSLNTLFANPKPSQEGLKILFVDHNANIRHMGRSTLQKAGHTVTLAQDGEETLDLLEENGPFDLLLMDLLIPQMNGFQVSQIIRSGRLTCVNTEIPILYLSDKEAHQHPMVDDNGADFIEKPLKTEKLLAMIEKYTKTNKAFTEQRDTLL